MEAYCASSDRAEHDECVKVWSQLKVAKHYDSQLKTIRDYRTCGLLPH